MAPGAEDPGAPPNSPLSIPGLAGQGPPTMAPMAQDAMGNPIPALIIPVQDWQDHRLHIDVHNKYRKSQAFDQAPEYIKKLFADHVQQHVDAIVRGQLAQVPTPIMQQLQQQGTNPSSPAAYQEMQHNQAQAGGASPPSSGPQTPPGGGP